MNIQRKIKSASSCLNTAIFIMFFGVLAQIANAGGLQAGTLAFSADFDGANALQGWSTNPQGSVSLVPGYQGKQALEVNVASGSNVPSAAATIGLPIDQFRGCTLYFHCMVKANGVSTPPEPYNGIKFMLHLTSPEGDQYPEDNGWGTFDWTSYGFKVTIPEDVTNAVLVLGLQDSAGRVDFDQVTVTVLSRRRTQPAHPPTGVKFIGHTLPRLRGTMLATNATPSDVVTLGNVWNANEVRYEFLWSTPNGDGANTADTSTYGSWLSDRLNYMDYLMSTFKKAGLLVLVDVHSPPGGVDAQGHNRIVIDKIWQDYFVAMWEKIALRYRDCKQIWGYDLTNEPNDDVIGDGLLDWHDLAALTARRVRAIDPNHAIVIEPDGALPAELNTFEPIDVRGVVYSIHMYAPNEYTQQGILGYPSGTAYPGIIAGKMWNKSTIRAYLEPAIEYAHDYNVQIYVGEFSAIRWAPGAAQYLSDCIDLFEENKWDWSYHAWREWEGWSPEIGSDINTTTPSKLPTDRGLLL